MSEVDSQQRMSRQIDRNTERLDNHAALIADLAARMHITEHQAERLWSQLAAMEQRADTRHSETLQAIHELKIDGNTLSTEVEVRGKMIGKMLAGSALLVATGWAAWQLAAALFEFLKRAGA